MSEKNKNDLLNYIDKKIVYIAVSFALAISYYMNPLENVGLKSWNRSLGTAVLKGISINLRIGNFYRLFFITIPVLTISIVIVLAIVFKSRSVYKDYFFKLIYFVNLITIVSYISRYSLGSAEINRNCSMEFVTSFFVVLILIALIDSNSRLLFEDITMLFVADILCIIVFNMLFNWGNVGTILISSIIVISIGVIITQIARNDIIIKLVKDFVLISMWIPLLGRLTLEILYFCVEKGYKVENYFSYLIVSCTIFMILALVGGFLNNKKRINLTNAGYIGAITSAASMSAFQYRYQYIWDYMDYANIYELGNKTVALDTILNNKIPIADYFSAHALGDVWSSILFGIIHNDTNAAFADPYAGLSVILASIILFLLLKILFDEHFSVLFVMLFPGYVTGIKYVSVCFLVVLMVVSCLKKRNSKNYIFFWLSALLVAFYSYDEGISLGVACIISFAIIIVLEKKYSEVIKFTVCGICVAILFTIISCIYAIFSHISIIARIREWISLGLGSNSTWATAEFGNQSTFAYFISYFVVPFSSICLLVVVLDCYRKKRKNGVIVLLTSVFAFTEILYITRSIVFHNLAVCSGSTGVLLNFVHWTISLYVLYMVKDDDRSADCNFFIWAGTFFLIIILEGSCVTGYFPTQSSTILSKSIEESEKWNIYNGNTTNNGKDRIVPNERTVDLIDGFSFIFDSLLEENETFIDFANVTSLYAMTNRERPCYVSQTPSLLTDIYSQKCYLDEIGHYSCPLAIIGINDIAYIKCMTDIPHNIRYYKIAEYIYSNYRPLVAYGDFAIWCEKENYNEYIKILQNLDFGDDESVYVMIDYGYDFDSNNHTYNIFDLPYIWANYDEYLAIENDIITELFEIDENNYSFGGSQYLYYKDGNYLVLDITSYSDRDVVSNVVLSDHITGLEYKYSFNVKPGINTYMIRVSQDYYWSAYNIDSIEFNSIGTAKISNVRILSGD